MTLMYSKPAKLTKVLTKCSRIKLTPAQKLKLRKWWKAFEEVDDNYWVNIRKLEENMAKDTGIKDIEFFVNDGGIVGIGNASRTLKLQQFKYEL